MRKRKLSPKYKLLILLFLITGVALRLVLYTRRGSLVFDEYFSVDFTKNLFELRRTVLSENSPPFFYFLLYLWQKIFPELKDNPRLLALIIAFIQMPVAYLIGSKIASKRRFKAGTIALILTATSPFLVEHASFGRMYSLLTLLSSLTILYAFQYLEKNRVWPLAVTAILISTTHIFGIFQAAALYLILISIKPSKKIILSSGVALIPIAIWFAFQLPGRNLGSFSQGWYWNIPFSSGDFLEIPFSFFVGYIQSGAFQACATLVVTIALYSTIKQLVSTEMGKKKALVLFGTCLLTITLGFIAGISTAFYYAGLPIIIILALAVANAESNSKIFPILTTSLVFITITSSTITAQQYKPACYDLVTKHIEALENKNEPIYVVPFFRKMVLEKYYQGENTVLGLGTRPNQNERQAIISTNWQKQYDQEGFEQLIQEIKEKNFFIVLRDRVFTNLDYLLPSLANSGLQVKNARYFDCNPDMWVFQVTKNE